MASAILIIDDDELIRRRFRQICEKANYNVHEASNYSEAETLIKANAYETVLCDIYLQHPILGTQALQMIHAQDPDLPVILMTGLPEVDTATQAVRYQAFDYIAKPVDAATLVHILEKAVTFRRLVMQNRAYQQNLEQMVEERTQQLIASQVKYKNLFDLATDAMFLMTAELEIEDINRAGLKMLGYRRDEIIKQNFTKFTNPDPNKTTPLGINLKGGSSLNQELTLYRSDQLPIQIELNISEIKIENEPHPILQGIARNITERKKNEAIIRQQNIDLTEMNKKLQVANKIQADILNLISHELRTPLTVICGTTELLRDFHETLKPEERLECIDRIMLNVNRQSQIVDQLLMATRLSRGEVQLKFNVTNLNELTAMIYHTKKPDFATKGLRFIHTPSQKPVYIQADESYLTYAFSCVLDNAYKFTPESGTVELKVVTENQEAVISVRDTGIGISKEQLENIFETFYQIELSMTRHFGGLGLGLFVTRELVKLNQGVIRVNSKPGEGSTFYLRFPLTSATASVPDIESRPSEKTPASSWQVLIVDDNSDVVNLLRISLAKENFRILTALSGPEALSKLQTPVNLIILDLMMPGMDGFQVCEEIKRNPATKDIPIIILSGQARDEEKIRAFALGISDYIVKPFRRHQLLAVIDRLREKALV